MRKSNFKNEIAQCVDDINKQFGKKLLRVSGLQTQWERGNGSVIRTDTERLATLLINWHDGCLGIGCDGKKMGINNYLAQRFSIYQQNTQNIRYKCNYIDLRAVLEYYAGQ